MKEQRIGVCTFLPLDKIKVKPINEKYRMLGGTAKPVIDVIQYPFSQPLHYHQSNLDNILLFRIFP